MKDLKWKIEKSLLSNLRHMLQQQKKCGFPSQSSKNSFKTILFVNILNIWKLFLPPATMSFPPHPEKRPQVASYFSISPSLSFAFFLYLMPFRVGFSDWPWVRNKILNYFRQLSLLIFPRVTWLNRRWKCWFDFSVDLYSNKSIFYFNPQCLRNWIRFFFWFTILCQH